MPRDIQKISNYFCKGSWQNSNIRVFSKIGGSSSFLQEVPPLATDGEHFCFQFWIFPFAFSYKILKYSVPDNKTINFAIFGFLFLCMVWRGGSERSHRCFCFYFYSFIFSFKVIIFTFCIWEFYSITVLKFLESTK